MDLLKIENIKKVFKEFASTPSTSYVSVYNALTKNYNDSEKQDNENDFQTFKNFFAEKSDLFEKGFEPYTPSQDNPGFYHVVRKGYHSPRQYRIYINPSIEGRLEFVKKLIEECEKNNIDFYFKYSRTNTRTDNLLIYASEEQLEQYARVLHNIEEEYPNLVSQCGDTPLSATRIGWYACGIEDDSSKKGSLSKRVANIVRRNITKILIQNRELYTKQQLSNTDAIKRLFKACVDEYASYLPKEDGDVFRMAQHKALEESFINNADNIAHFVLTSEISDEQIDDDLPLIKLVAGGEEVPITPNAISTMLAQEKPNFKSMEQREEIYKSLQTYCERDINAEGLNQKVPDKLSVNFELENE